MQRLRILRDQLRASVRLSVRDDPGALELFEYLQDDLEFVRELVQINPNVWQHASPRVQRNVNLALEAARRVQKDRDRKRFIEQQITKQPVLAVAVLGEHFDAARHHVLKYSFDRGEIQPTLVVPKTVRWEDPMALQRAIYAFFSARVDSTRLAGFLRSNAIELREDHSRVGNFDMHAVEVLFPRIEPLHAILAANELLRNDRGFALKVLEVDGTSLSRLGWQWRGDVHMVQIAVSQSAEAWFLATPDLRTSSAIIEAAIRTLREARSEDDLLAWCERALQCEPHDPGLAEILVSQSAEVWFLATPNLRRSPVIIKAAIETLEARSEDDLLAWCKRALQCAPHDPRLVETFQSVMRERGAMSLLWSSLSLEEARVLRLIEKDGVWETKPTTYLQELGEQLGVGNYEVAFEFTLIRNASKHEERLCLDFPADTTFLTALQAAILAEFSVQLDDAPTIMGYLRRNELALTDIVEKRPGRLRHVNVRVCFLCDRPVLDILDALGARTLRFSCFSFASYSRFCVHSNDGEGWVNSGEVRYHDVAWPAVFPTTNNDYAGENTLDPHRPLSVVPLNISGVYFGDPHAFTHRGNTRQARGQRLDGKWLYAVQVLGRTSKQTWIIDVIRDLKILKGFFEGILQEDPSMADVLPLPYEFVISVHNLNGDRKILLFVADASALDIKAAAVSAFGYGGDPRIQAKILLGQVNPEESENWSLSALAEGDADQMYENAPFGRRIKLITVQLVVQEL